MDLYQNSKKRIAILISFSMIPLLYLIYSIFLNFNFLESFEGRLLFSRVFLVCIAAYLITVACALVAPDPIHIAELFYC